MSLPPAAHITLFLTEKGAFQAGWEENYRREKEGMETTGMRVLAATMRDHDGTVDQGFKVLMVPPRGIGHSPYFL